MILNDMDWLNKKAYHYMDGFLSEPDESGRIVGVAIADPPTDFILTLHKPDGSFTKARASMCLVAVE